MGNPRIGLFIHTFPSLIGEIQGLCSQSQDCYAKLRSELRTGQSSDCPDSHLAVTRTCRCTSTCMHSRCCTHMYYYQNLYIQGFAQSGNWKQASTTVVSLPRNCFYGCILFTKFKVSGTHWLLGGERTADICSSAVIQSEESKLPENGLMTSKRQRTSGSGGRENERFIKICGRQCLD